MLLYPYIMGLHERVFLVEGDGRIAIELETAYLEGAGHVIVKDSDNLPDALVSIEEAKKKGATVAVVDLARGKYADIHDDTRIVANAIGEHVPGLPVIVFSSEHPGNVGGIHVSKSVVNDGGGPKRLAEAVSAIPR